MLATVANPYWFLWWATVGSTYILLGLRQGMLGFLAVYVGHIASDFSWYTAVSAAATRGRQWLAGRTYAAVLLLFGIYLWSMALYFGLSGARMLGWLL